MSKLYLENGYFNAAYCYEKTSPLIMVIGGRGTGKTYGVPAEAYKRAKETGRKFIYMRRRKNQIDLINVRSMSIFQAYNADNGTHIEPEPVGAGVFGYFDHDDDGKQKGELLGYNFPLATFSNYRSLYFEDVDTIIYDEFIPQDGERPIKHEAVLLRECIETVNRNRELKGAPPVKVILLTNANRLDNDILLDFGLVEPVTAASARGEEVVTFPEKGLTVLLLDNSPISKRKAETAYYKDANSYAEMALDNRFDMSDYGEPAGRNLREYKPICYVGEIGIYRHKDRAEWYVTTHKQGKPKDIYGTGERDLMAFHKKHFLLLQKWLNGKILFETRTAEILFKRYMGV